MSTDNTTQETTPTTVLGRVDEAICALDDDWELTYVNEAAATLVDRDSAALIGESLWEAFPELRDSSASDALHDAVETQEPRRFDIAYDERDAWFTVRAYPSTDGLTVCFHEVTDQREQERTLQRSQRLFESVFDETTDALVIADTDHRITDCNPAAERLFGYDASDVLGEHTALLYADTEALERQGDERHNEQAPQRRDPRVVEYERADGTTFDGETVRTQIAGQEGETVAFCLTIRDVTTQIECGDEMERRNHTLRQFHKITTDESDPFDTQVTAVLELATEYLGLERGRLAEIVDQTHIPHHVAVPEDVSAATEQRPLDETFCERAATTAEPFGFPDPSEAGLADHPAAEQRGIEAYIGVPVYVDGEQYGTLGFASTDRRADAFSESEETFVRIVAQWAGKEISRRQNRTQAREERQRLRQITDLLPQLVFAKDESGTFILANEAVADAYGTTVDKLQGAKDIDFAESEAEAEQFRADDRAVIDSGEPKEIDAEPLTTADGTERIFATKKIPYDPVDSSGDAILGVSTEITELKQREKELEVQSAAMEAAMDGISILDADGEYIYMNEAHAAVFDYNPDELLGSSWRRLYDEEEIRRLEADVFPTLEAQGQWRGETIGRRRDGTPVSQEITLSSLPDGKLICTNRDITERKDRQSELEQYEALVENINEMAFIIDSDRRLAFANETALSYADVTPSSVLGQDVAELIEALTGDGDDSSAFTDAMARTLDGEHVDERYELPLVTSTGEYVMEYLFSPFRSDGERQAAVVARDITEQKAREQELERQQSRLRALFDESPDGIIVHDERGAVLDANMTQSELLGYAPETLKSMNVSAFEVGVDQPALRELWQGMDIGDTKKIEGNHRHQTGEIYPVEVWVSKTDVHGQPRFIALSRDISERKEREHEMVRNREFLEKTQEIASVGGWEVDLRQDEIRWTDEMYRIHDLPLDTDVTIEDGIDYYHPEDRPTITAAYERLVETGEPYDIELRIVTAAGDVRWVRTIGDPQLDDGAVVGVRGIFQDITEQKRLEQSLRQSERSLRNVTEVASDTDREFEEKLDSILELGCERLGLSYGFLTRIEDGTQHIVEAMGSHSKLQAGAAESMSKAYCRHTVQQDEPLAIQNAAEADWLDDDAYDTFELGCYIGGKIVVNGDLYGTLCFADRKDRDKQFDESERAFVELLVQWLRYELASDTVETKLRQLNETAQRLLSATDSSEVASVAVESAKGVLDLPLTGIWWYDDAAGKLVPAGATDEGDALVGDQPTFAGGESLAWETFQDGEIATYPDLREASNRFSDETPMRSEIMAPLGEHGILISGSTQQRAFSETDQGLFEILTSTVETALDRAEREQILRDTRERLEQSNQELEQFAYAASHDLQEPLRTVSSYLTLLERRNRDVLDADAVEFIDFAVDGAERMQAMIQALLEYSRVDTRGQAFEPTDMDAVFRTVTQNLEVTISESGATVDLPASPAPIPGDVSQLTQLFQNLVENAVKYSEGEPHVDISVTRTDGEAIEYAVSDNGIGMDPSQLDDIFEVFQRLHTREEFDGTGIGLSICRKIVDRHDGALRVESVPGEGSTFFVTLPVAGERDE